MKGKKFIMCNVLNKNVIGNYYYYFFYIIKNRFYSKSLLAIHIRTLRN